MTPVFGIATVLFGFCIAIAVVVRIAAYFNQAD